MRPAITRTVFQEGRSGLSPQRNAPEGNLPAPLTRHALTKGPGRASSRSCHTVFCSEAGQSQQTSPAVTYGQGQPRTVCGKEELCSCPSPACHLLVAPVWQGPLLPSHGTNPLLITRGSQTGPVTWKAQGNVSAQHRDDSVVPSSSYKSAQGTCCRDEPGSGATASAREAQACRQGLCSGHVTRALVCRRPTSAL